MHDCKQQNVSSTMTRKIGVVEYIISDNNSLEKQVYFAWCAAFVFSWENNALHTREIDKVQYITSCATVVRTKPHLF